MKKEKMTARGVRFTELMWRAVCKKAKDQKVNPSDIVRDAVEEKCFRRV